MRSYIKKIISAFIMIFVLCNICVYAADVTVNIDEQKITAENLDADSRVIAAVYKNNVLVDTKIYAPDDEMNYAEDFNLTSENIMKVFVWNMKNLQPLYGVTTRYADGSIETAVPIPTPVPTPTPTPQLQTTTYTLNGVDFKMILVEGGTFTMGSDEEASKSGTQRSNQANEHQVTLSSYLIGETEVTRALWNTVMGSGSGSNEYPIASVTKPECDTFAQRLSQMAHEAGIIPDDVDFHVPTEAQWEFAAKGGNLSKGYTYAGSNTLSQVGWTSSDGNSVHKVKQKQPNELGIYDMSGNVYEWVADYAHPYTKDAQTNPCNMTPSSNYIKRGGSFYYNDSYRFTSTYRYFYSSTDYTIGVRICLY